MQQDTFILFGSTGDLSKRKIFPALYNLFLDDQLPSDLKIVCVGRKAFTETTFREYVKRSLENFSRRPIQISRLDQFLDLLQYFKLAIDNQKDYNRLFEELTPRKGQKLFYLSVSPDFFKPIASHLSASGFSKEDQNIKLLIEKPFGFDLTSAISLNEELSHYFNEEQVYRIDHFIGKSMVQQVDSFLQTNSLFQSLWTSSAITKMEFIASETVGVEERAGYYDTSGAMRDMIQNHMLQLFMLVASAFPSIPNKVSALEALAPNPNVILGQYGPGVHMGINVVGYQEETGVPQNSHTETFVSLTSSIFDIPVHLMSGKRLDKKNTQIIIHFQDTRIIFNIAPEESIIIELGNTSLCSPLFELPEAYENIISDAFLGNKRFFAHWEEVKASWEYLQPIIDQMKEKSYPLHIYPSGSHGPKFK